MVTCVQNTQFVSLFIVVLYLKEKCISLFFFVSMATIFVSFFKILISVYEKSEINLNIYAMKDNSISLLWQ
jgi:hypothetical protein